MEDEARVGRELALRAAVLAGEEAAWRTLYDAAHAQLRAFVHWRLAAEAAGADEVVQESWLIAVRRMRDFDPRRGTFLDWLRGIAGNVIKNRSRQRQTAQAVWESLPAVASASADEPLEVAERSARVAAALSSLPEHYAAVLHAKYLEQRSVSDIAQAWNQTAKAIESLLTRARLAFREQFGVEG
jgi:RNA polymerase sigma-70 factor, ECF subfamily